jgi:sigma-B regulation protein RsbU (phosphoserine phosphatase)
MLFFLLGAASGALALFWLGVKARARADRIEEEKLVLAQEKQMVMDFMHHMVEAMGEGLSREDLLQRIARAALLCTGALSACIFEKRSDNKMQGAAVEGLFPPHRPLQLQAKAKLTTRARFIEQLLKSEVFDVGEGIVGQVARTGEGVLVADAPGDPRIVKHDDPALAVRSIIAAPIRFQDRMIGVLAVANPADGMPFTPTDLSLVMSLAEQAGLAVHNIESLHFQIEKKQLDLDLALAASIQQMLLPGATPQVAGLDVAAQYVPAQKVGGDLYDFIPLSPSRLGIAVADVSGKGIPASLLMRSAGRTCGGSRRATTPRRRCSAGSTAPWRGRSAAGCSSRLSTRWSMSRAVR